MHVSLQVLETRAQALLVLRGDIDLVGRGLLSRRLDEAVACAVPLVVIDAGDVTFIDSCSLRLIDQARSRQQDAGRRLVIDRASECFRLVALLARYDDLVLLTRGPLELSETARSGDLV